MEPITLTVGNSPDHTVIGRYFRAWDGKDYLCESWVENMGYWMAEVDTKQRIIPDGRRTNVSERAIGRTYHPIRYNRY